MDVGTSLNLENFIWFVFSELETILGLGGLTRIRLLVIGAISLGCGAGMGERVARRGPRGETAGDPLAMGFDGGW